MAWLRFAETNEVHTIITADSKILAAQHAWLSISIHTILLDYCGANRCCLYSWALLCNIMVIKRGLLRKGLENSKS